MIHVRGVTPCARRINSSTYGCRSYRPLRTGLEGYAPPGFEEDISQQLVALISSRASASSSNGLTARRYRLRWWRNYPIHLRAYDLLVEAGEDLRPLPFAVRRARLEAFVARLDDPRVSLSPLVPFADWDDLARIRAYPEAAGAGVDAPAIERLMLKRRDAPYVSGRPRGPWFKWKRDPFNVDAVMMYAQRGSGKRSSLYSDFTFGVWHEGPDGDALISVGKSYFGFTDEELGQLDRYVRENTASKFGPVREVVANANQGLVLEIAFEGLNRSKRHKSGVAMRFPRISRIRWDKPTIEADRLETLTAMLDQKRTATI